MYSTVHNYVNLCYLQMYPTNAWIKCLYHFMDLCNICNDTREKSTDSPIYGYSENNVYSIQNLFQGVARKKDPSKHLPAYNKIHK